MCEHPLVIVSINAQISLSHCDEVVFNGVPRCSLTDVYNFLSEYRNLSLSTVDSVVKNSYFILEGNKCPIFSLLPCGRCKYCLSNYKKEIENRSIIEASGSGTCIFYTLTYSDTYLPPHGLRRSDVSQAFKRLRIYINRYLNKDIHFTNLYVGEYGTDPHRSLRPHYHGILFFDIALSSVEIETIRQMFLPTQFSFSCQYCPVHKRELLNRRIIKIDPYTKEVVFESPFYDKHPDLDGFWPYGLFFDFQVARDPIALCRYVTKYITKRLEVDNDQFAVNKEIDEAHWEPFFIQMPKRIGLGCRHLDKYSKFIYFSGSPTLTVRYSVIDKCSGQCRVKFTRVKVPNIFIRKLFPTVGSLVPNCFITAHLIHSLIAGLHSLRQSLFDCLGNRNSKGLSSVSYSNDVFDLNLQNVIDRFSPYEYLTKIHLKLKEKLKVDYLTTWILAPYHNHDYQTVLNSRNYPPEFELDIFVIFDELLSKLNYYCSYTHYKQLTFDKLNYYSRLQIPDMSYEDRKLRQDLSIEKDLSYVRDKMVHSSWNYFS